MLPRIWVEGRLTEDPTLRFAPSGVAVCNFSVVCSDRRKNEQTNEWEDVTPTFFRCTTFKQLAENCAESLTKGTLVILGGKIKQEKYTNKDGEDRTSYQNIVVDTIGPSLMFATARVIKAERGGTSASEPKGPAAADPWGGAPASGFSEDPPF